MTERERRSLVRNKVAVVNTVHLHSENHTSFHSVDSLSDSWNILARLSQEKYFQETGSAPLNYVDKTVVRISKRKN